MTRFKNQRALTQTADLVGENWGRSGQCGRDGDAGPISIGGEQLIDICEIERRDILRVWLEVLDGDTEKGRDCCRKQTSLYTFRVGGAKG